MSSYNTNVLMCVLFAKLAEVDDTSCRVAR